VETSLAAQLRRVAIPHTGINPALRRTRDTRGWPTKRTGVLLSGRVPCRPPMNNRRKRKEVPVRSRLSTCRTGARETRVLLMSCDLEL